MAKDESSSQALDIGHATARIEELRSQIGTAVKPRLRGWLHFGAAPLAFVLGLVLLVITPEPELRLAVAIYLATTVLLFGVSASYHLGAGGQRMNAALNRLDHANIYLFIAGSYTPFAVALTDQSLGWIMLGLVWAIALIGVAVRVLWWKAPRWLVVSSYLALGWVSILFLPAVYNAFGAMVVFLLLLGGLFYSVGAVVFARRRPDPHPDWFGFHEVFHALTIVAFLVQYVAICMVVT